MTASQKINEIMGADMQNQQGGAGGAEQHAAEGAKPKDAVIDAEYTEVNDKK